MDILRPKITIRFLFYARILGIVWALLLIPALVFAVSFLGFLTFGLNIPTAFGTFDARALVVAIFLFPPVLLLSSVGQFIVCAGPRTDKKQLLVIAFILLPLVNLLLLGALWFF